MHVIIEGVEILYYCLHAFKTYFLREWNEMEKVLTPGVDCGGRNIGRPTSSSSSPSIWKSLIIIIHEQRTRRRQLYLCGPAISRSNFSYLNLTLIIHIRKDSSKCISGNRRKSYIQYIYKINLQYCVNLYYNSIF